MQSHLLSILACPRCASELQLDSKHEVLLCESCVAHFPIVNGIPRFVTAENYAANFGMQWNCFRQTQLDSQAGVSVSRERFFAQSGWPENLGGARILDVGCGAGRFTEIALSAGAYVVALDYSSAVDACQQNLGSNPRLSVVQADIYHLPFKRSSFDYVYCFGVLQHTPDVAEAFSALPAQLKKGGRICVDVYPKLRLNVLWPKYWLRPLTRRMRPAMLFKCVKAMVPILLPISRLIARIPLVGRKLRYAVPVVNYEGVYPLSREQLREWSVLDTFDMLSPAYDQPQTAETLRTWFEKAGLTEIEIFRRGFIIGRGAVPA